MPDMRTYPRYLLRYSIFDMKTPILYDSDIPYLEPWIVVQTHNREMSHMLF